MPQKAVQAKLAFGLAMWLLLWQRKGFALAGASGARR